MGRKRKLKWLDSVAVIYRPNKGAPLLGRACGSMIRTSAYKNMMGAALVGGGCVWFRYENIRSVVVGYYLLLGGLLYGKEIT